MRTSGSADIALANRKWKWPTVSPSNVGKASLISNRYVCHYEHHSFVYYNCSPKGRAKSCYYMSAPCTNVVR